MKSKPMLPELKEYIYQPNRITKAEYDYTLIQVRLFNAVVYHLQDVIHKRIKGVLYKQLSLFDNDLSYISFEIPLKEIASNSAQYGKVKESLKELASIVVTIPYRNEAMNENRIRYVGLFRADIPEQGKRCAKIIIEIDKMVAKKIIDIDLNQKREPINYTKFYYHIALKSRIKYTPRIYQLLCSWRKKGHFVITVDDFRKWLGIENKYKYYRDIKNNVLKPVQNELINLNADCWFDCDMNDFEIKEGNKVISLFFRVMSHEHQAEESKRKDYVEYLLRTHYGFSDEDFRQVDPIFKYPIMQEVISKISYLSSYLSDDSIRDKKKYLSDSLLREFK
jgi:hypothetical protein